MHSGPEPPVHPDDPNSNLPDLSQYEDTSHAGDWSQVDDEVEVKTGTCTVDDSVDMKEANQTGSKRDREDSETSVVKHLKAEDGTTITINNMFRGNTWYMTVNDQLEGKLKVNLKQDDQWSAGVVIIDGLDMQKTQLVKELKSRMPEVVSYLKPGQIAKMQKGGFRLTLKPEDCPKLTGWIGLLSKTPEKVRVHPPASHVAKLNRTVFIYGVDASLTDDCVKNSLLPPVESVQRCYRDGKPTKTCKVTYCNQHLAGLVIEAGKVLLDEYVFLRAAKPNKRKQTEFCRTCKHPITACEGGPACSKLRCGYCKAKHKTKDCKLAPKDRVCIQCNSAEHTVFKCPNLAAVNKVNRDEREKRKNESKKVKQKSSNSYAAAVVRGAENNGKSTSKQDTQNQENSEAAVDESVMQQFMGLTTDDILEAIVASMTEYIYPDLHPDLIEELTGNSVRKLKAKMARKSEDPIHNPESSETQMSIDDTSEPTSAVLVSSKSKSTGEQVTKESDVVTKRMKSAKNLYQPRLGSYASSVVRNSVLKAFLPTPNHV